MDLYKIKIIYSTYLNLFIKVVETAEQFYDKWTICDHPQYGLNISSFDRPEEKNYQGCLNEKGIPKDCTCNQKSTMPVD